jgi:hypothetical protein
MCIIRGSFLRNAVWKRTFKSIEEVETGSGQEHTCTKTIHKALITTQSHDKRLNSLRLFCSVTNRANELLLRPIQ